MQARIEVQEIATLTLQDGRQVGLLWTPDADGESSGFADVFVDGFYPGEIIDRGYEDPDAITQYRAARYLTATDVPGGSGDMQFRLNTNDLLEAVAFAAAGPDGWTPDPLYMRHFLSAADSGR